MNSEIKLYDISNIDQLHWPDTEDALYARNYIEPMIKNSVLNYVNNCDTEIKILKINDTILPVTINNNEYNNSYVCSFYTHYITYAIEELKTLKSHFIESIVKLIIKFLGIILKYGQINKVVIVNNWLLSTNLYPEIAEEEIKAITELLKATYPVHAIVLRSINSYAYPDLHKSLINNNYKLIASRQVYFLDRKLIKGKAKWLIKKDFKLLDNSGYETIDNNELSKKDIPRIKELYDLLYLDKYSTCNPQFSEEFIELALKEKTLHLRALKKGDKIDAVLGYFTRNGTMTTPLFGYDTNLPAQTGLYRMLSAILIRESEDLNLLLHQSSGAASFKSCRASKGGIEYNAVYCKHLPVRQQRCWQILERVVNIIGIFILKKFKL